MLVARAVAVPWGVLIVLGHGNPPYPPGVRAASLAAVGVLAVATVVLAAALRWARRPGPLAAAAVAGLVVDAGVVGALVLLNTFDPGAALWALLFVLPLEGALLFALPGALVTWGATATLYAVREVWGSAAYGYVLSWHSIAFRMGIGLLIALVAGLMARDLVRQRTRLAEALAGARELDRLRAELVAMLAHDIRTPLTVIRQGIATLQHAGERIDDVTRTALLAATDRHAGRLERLATGLLDMARLETGQLVLDAAPMDVRAIVTGALASVDPAGDIGVDVPAELMVTADRDRLEQVVVNLAANALRHGAPPVRIEATASDGMVDLLVIDHGPGLPARSDDSAPFQPGLAPDSVGFGLTVARRLVEAHDGHLSYERRNDQTRFTVRLPAG